MNHRPILVFILLSFVFGHANAQKNRYWELGGQIGGSLYAGDLTPSNPLYTLNEIKTVLGGQIKYNFNRFSIGVEFCSTRLSGTDANSDKANIKERNFSFESSLRELAIMAEFNLLKFDPIYSKRVFTPYAKFGVAGFYFNPTTFYNGQWVELQPLGTEGQGTSLFPEVPKYSRYALAIPVGGGLKIRMTEGLVLFIDATLRYTFTDYIDDVSTKYADYNVLLKENGNLAAELAYRQDEFLGTDTYPIAGSKRGGSGVDDHYFIGTVGLRYTFQEGGGLLPFRIGGRRSRVKCPTF